MYSYKWIDSQEHGRDKSEKDGKRDGQEGGEVVRKDAVVLLNSD